MTDAEPSGSATEVSPWALATTGKGTLLALGRFALFMALALGGALLLSSLLKAATGRTLLDLADAGSEAALLGR